MKRLSVVIPGYNTPKSWWIRCVSSVLNAIGPNDEIVVVDDGSSDDYAVESGWWVDARVRVLRRENGGLSRARNSGVDVASGEYITFVDSDDEVLPRALDRCILKLDETKGDVCVYGVETIWVSDGLKKVDCPDEKFYGELSARPLYDLSQHCLLNYAWNKVYRAEFLRKNQISFNVAGMPCEDVIYNLNCILRGAKWCSVAAVGYVYRHTRSSSLARYKPTLVSGLRACSETWRRYKAFSKGGRKVLGRYGEWNAISLLKAEWKNIWMSGSPYSLHGRWLWLRRHNELGGALLFFKTFVYFFVRRHLYIKPLRRYKIKRNYPHASPFKEVRARG